jgi:PAS domain S-box-containing protein
MPTRHSGRHSNCIDRAQMLPGAHENQTESLLAAPSGASRWLRVRLRGQRLAAFLGILFCILHDRYALADQNAKNVLILYSFSSNTVPGGAEPLKSALRVDAPWPLNFAVEFLESRRFTDQGYENSVVETLGHTYKGQRFDLVITSSYPALDFAVKHRGELFPSVPIMFLGVDASRFDGRKLWPGVTGVTQTVPLQKTIELAFHLHPNTKTVAILTNVSEFENYWLARLHAELARSQKGVKVIDMVALPTSQVFERVAALPPHSIVFFQRAPQTAIQPAIGDYEMLAWVGQHFPTYCIFPEICLDHGGIGGFQIDLENDHSMAARLARRVLSGERPDDIPVVQNPGYQLQVDWRQLRYWKIPESALPPDSLILYREPTLWERGRKYFLVGMAVIIAQALLIFGLLWQRARKRKAEAGLRESEERFRVMADTTPSLVWMCDAQGKITYLNEQRLAFTGPDPNAGYGDTWIAYIHPDDVKNVLNALWQALRDQKPFSKEYRLHRSDGTYRWMFDVASPRVNGDGSFAGFIGSAIDVTDQKHAQRALEQISGQLIEAQEKERTRIARDLHDDICQRLALLSMELEQAKSVSKGRVEATRSLEAIRQHCSEIAGDVQSLSHQLHSSKLDFLGIVTAIRGFCKEFSKQNSVSVEFTDRQLPKHLPKDVSLCLFRVAQEALHNAVKYSGTTRFTVELSATANEVQLQVTDAGAGFDLEQTKKNRGLGLVSMQERVHQVHGKFSVESKPGEGTKIIAVVPLVAENRQVSEEGETKNSASALEPA